MVLRYISICSCVFALFSADIIFARSDVKKKNYWENPDRSISHHPFGFDDCGDAGPLEPGEPAFCTFDALMLLQTDIKNTNGMERAVAFKIGDYTLAGYGVGSTEPDRISETYRQFASNRDAQNSTNPTERDENCTLLLNEPRSNQGTHSKVANTDPKDGKFLDPTEGSKALDLMKSSFQTNMPFMNNCLDRSKFLAMGCTQMRHRGPQWFGAALVMLKCSPKHAENIVCRTWGRGIRFKKVSHEDRLIFMERISDYRKQLEASRVADALQGKPATLDPWVRVVESFQNSKSDAAFKVRALQAVSGSSSK
jgi:hypothetical protein